MIFLIGLFIVSAFLLQGLLGIFQIKNFSKNYRELRLLGAYRILIGKNPKRFFSGTLMLIAIDDNGNIKEARLMQGVTFFAKFKSVKELRNKNIAILAADYQELSKMNRLTRQCLLNAYKTFVDFKTKKLSASAYDTSKNVFNMPLFTKVSLLINNLKMSLSKN